jgi:hemin uptake protein HemP
MSAKDVEPLPSNDDTSSTEPAPTHQRVFDSRTLFGDAREIRISHNGASYCLRLTRLGKLILTK